MQIFYYLPKGVLGVGWLQILGQTAFIFLYNVNWLAFVTEAEFLR